MNPDRRSLPSHTAATVILVHGLWTPAAVFALQDRWLQQHGYRPLRFGYPSVRLKLSQNVQGLQHFVATTDATEIHLVGHSLGGLVILDMLRQMPDPRLRRVVLLGTPCLDSHCARRLAGLAGMPALLGRSIMEWLSRASDATVGAGSAVEVGVLAGTRSVGLGRLVPGLPQPNDGVVALAETRLAGAADSIELPIAHSEMLASRRCAAQIASFLQTGRFQHDRQD
ncbi:putative acetyltransferase/hydrolase [Candidatus Accumulibacter aalborgensis]|uniref:Putative acetyltransferase/hydrolase n=1 Tax=Candidatus Accumulibacter aalborgensis TaxID=1860102 RepID=A0A1A8XU21_9PROT|nr:alpha/beta fold hydrolase [Candidatus Accumulibacter aalborgensis]SBT08236.1 putative acetyltransferase/hydrolase [Candidatus Accumulibacter aalborgensis]